MPTSDPKRILVLGTGHLGVRTLEALLRSPSPHSYVVAGRDAERTRRLVNLLRQLASAFGDSASIEPATIDVADIAGTASTIARFRPDVIYSTISMQSWWVVGALPAHLADPLAPSCVGPWLPMHLTLLHELMQAVRAASSSATVVNAAYPDATHPVLATAGLAPDLGIGNIAIPLVGLRLHLADQLRVPVTDVHVRGVFHHYVNFVATRNEEPIDAPMHLSAWLGSPDPSDRGNVPIELDPVVPFRPLATTLKRLSGPHFQHVTGATAAVVLRALLDGTDVRTHAPGPLGLPGGYPVRLLDSEVHLDLPSGMTLDEAVAINIEGGRHDGIEAIGTDGTVRFRDVNREPLRRELGFDVPVLRLHESRAVAEELAERFARYAGTIIGVPA